MGTDSAIKAQKMGIASGDVKLQVKRSEDKYWIITYPGKADKPHLKQELYY